MTCLTVTPSSAAEAIRRNANIIVTHHPLPFKPLKRITTDNVPGQLLYDLIRGNVAIYRPHTAFDSAAAGINQQLAQSLGLSNVKPLVAAEQETDPGSGRYGALPKSTTVQDVADNLKSTLKIENVKCVGDPSKGVSKGAVACGSAGSFLGAAKRHGCDLFVTGETTFHTCLEAEALGVAMLLVGHYASERFACEKLAEIIQAEFGDAEVWASEDESDPLRSV